MVTSTLIFTTAVFLMGLVRYRVSSKKFGIILAPFIVSFFLKVILDEGYINMTTIQVVQCVALLTLIVLCLISKKEQNKGLAVLMTPLVVVSLINFYFNIDFISGGLVGATDCAYFLFLGGDELLGNKKEQEL